MQTEQKESIWNKIIVGVAIATLPVIILYYLGIDKKNDPANEKISEYIYDNKKENVAKIIDYGRYVGFYRGISLNTSGHQKGDTYLYIREVDNLTQKVKIDAEWNNGLYGAGRLFGKIEGDKIEAQGTINSDVTGSWDIDMEIILHTNSQQVEGNYKLFPTVGNINGTQYGQFTLNKQQ